MNVPEVANKISECYSVLSRITNSPDEIANKINSILIYGDGIPRQLLSSAWDYFAQKKGVKQ